MKNVLNDDGDKISLFTPNGVFVSSCEKSADGEVTIVGDRSGDVFPMSKIQIMSMVNMYLCYWRITMVFCMYMFTDKAPILFLGAFMLSLLLDSMTRTISGRSDNCNYLFTGLATICDFFLLVVLYNAMGQQGVSFFQEEDSFQMNTLSYQAFMTIFLSSAGKLLTPGYMTTLMRSFLVIDLLAYGCHLFSLLFQNSLEYQHISEKYKQRYPKMTGTVQIMQATFVLQHYGLSHIGSMPLMDSILYSVTLCSFLFMRSFNIFLIFCAIRLWTVNSEVELSDAGEELEEYLRLQSPAPMLDSRIALSNPRRTSMASSASTSPAAANENTPSPRPVAHRHAASLIRSNIRKKSKASSTSSSSTSVVPTADISTSTTTATNTATKSKKRKSVSIASPQSPNELTTHPDHRHHHLGESHIQSNYSLRDGSSLEHNPHNPYVLHDDEGEAQDQEATKKKVKKSVSIQEVVQTPSKTPSNSTKGRKKTPAAKSK